MSEDTDESQGQSNGVRFVFAGIGVILGFSFLAGDFMGGAVAGLTGSDALGESSGLLGMIIGGVIGYFAIELITFIVIALTLLALYMAFR